MNNCFCNNIVFKRCNYCLSQMSWSEYMEQTPALVLLDDYESSSTTKSTIKAFHRPTTSKCQNKSWLLKYDRLNNDDVNYDVLK